MSRNDTWMPLYLGDYMADTMHLNGAQHGAYLLLLMHYWRNGPLPNDDAQLAAIARTEFRVWQAIRSVLRSFFTVNGDGLLHQKRMDRERERWSGISDKRRIAGKAGADAKWNGGGLHPPDKPGGKPMANAMANSMANDMANDEQMPEICHDSAIAPLPSPFKKEFKTSGTPPTGAREASGSTEIEAIGPEKAAAVVLALQAATRMKAYPPRKAVRSPDEQISAVVETRPKAAYLTPEQLAMARRRTA